MGVRGLSHRSSKPFPQCRARHRDNDHANTRSLLLEDVEVTGRHGAVAHPAPIGPPTIDTRGQGGDVSITRARLDDDRGEVTKILGIG